MLLLLLLLLLVSSLLLSVLRRSFRSRPHPCVTVFAQLHLYNCWQLAGGFSAVVCGHPAETVSLCSDGIQQYKFVRFIGVSYHELASMSVITSVGNKSLTSIC
jgi:hypothetical protein